MDFPLTQYPNESELSSGGYEQEAPSAPALDVHPDRAVTDRYQADTNPDVHPDIGSTYNYQDNYQSNATQSGGSGIGDWLSALGQSLTNSGIPDALTSLLGFGKDEKKSLFGKEGIINSNAEAFKVLGTGVANAMKGKTEREAADRKRNAELEDRAVRNAAVAGQKRYGLVNSARKFVK